MSRFMCFSPRFFKVFLTAVLMCSCMAVSYAEVREASEDTDRGLFGLPLIPKDTIFKNCYAGVGAGMMSSNFARTNDDGSLAGNYDSDNSGLAGNVFFGYEFTDNLGVEAGYHYLGRTEMAGNSSGGPSWSAGPVRAENDVEGGSFSGVVRLPITERTTLIGTLGMFWWVSTETFEDGGVKTVEKDSGSSYTFSGGLEYDVGLKDRWVWRTQVQQYVVDNSDYDITQGTFSIVYKFP